MGIVAQDASKYVGENSLTVRSNTDTEDNKPVEASFSNMQSKSFNADNDTKDEGTSEFSHIHQHFATVFCLQALVEH